LLLPGKFLEDFWSPFLIWTYVAELGAEPSKSIRGSGSQGSGS
jgi:hypothetical protein